MNVDIIQFMLTFQMVQINLEIERTQVRYAKSEKKKRKLKTFQFSLSINIFFVTYFFCCKVIYAHYNFLFLFYTYIFFTDLDKKPASKVPEVLMCKHSFLWSRALLSCLWSEVRSLQSYEALEYISAQWCFKWIVI